MTSAMFQLRGSKDVGRIISPCIRSRSITGQIMSERDCYFVTGESSNPTPSPAVLAYFLSVSGLRRVRLV